MQITKHLTRLLLIILTIPANVYCQGQNRQLLQYSLPSEVSVVTFRPDGNLLASGRDDKTVRLRQLTPSAIKINPDPVPKLTTLNSLSFEFGVTNPPQTPLDPIQNIRYQWKLDNGNWSEPTTLTRVEIAALPDGIHTFQVKAIGDYWEIQPSRKQVSFIVDVFPEIQIQRFPRLISSEQEVTISYTGKDARTPTAELQYSWRIDGDKWSEWSDETSAKLSKLGRGSHLFEVRVKDADGNEATANTILTDERPMVRISKPRSMKLPRDGDTSPLFGYDLYIFGDDLQTSADQLQYSWRLDSGKWSSWSRETFVHLSFFRNGDYTFTVRVRDVDRNQASAEETFRVNQFPEIEISSPPEGKVIGTRCTFQFKGSDLQTPANQLQYAWQLDDGEWSDWSRETSAELSQLSHGTHSFKVRVLDKDGYTNSKREEFYVDLGLLVINNWLSDRDLEGGKFILKLDGQDLRTPPQPLQYSYKLNSEKWSNWSDNPTISLNGLKHGSSVLEAKLRDSQGNESHIYRTTLEVPIPFYRNPSVWIAFLTLLIVIFVIAGFIYYCYYRRQQYALKTKYNPYTPGSPIMEKNRFFGRVAFLRDLKASIHSSSFIIMGDNRIGKTSVLYRLIDELKNGESKEFFYLPFYIDISVVEEADKLFEQLFAETRRQIDEYKLEVDFDAIREKDREEDDDNYDRFQRAIDDILEKLRERHTEGRQIRLIFILDECDVLNDLGQKATARIRSIFAQKYAQNVGAILTGVSIHLDKDDRISAWWNPFVIKLMPPFTELEVRDLIQEPAGGIYDFEKAAVELILSWSQRNPYLVQLLCHEGVDMAIRNRRLKITAGYKRLKITAGYILNAISKSKKEKEAIRHAPRLEAPDG